MAHDANPLLARLRAEQALHECDDSTYQPGYDHAQASELSDLCMGHLTHRQMAGAVRMLLRGDLTHEAVVTAARDRIAWLARRVEVLEATLQASASVTRQLDMVKVYITDPTCREITERKINEAFAVLKAAGVEVEG